jgi:hypothetical protein
MNCVVYPSTRDELDVVWNGQLRNKQLALGEVQIRGLTPLHRPLPEEIDVSSWVSRKSWELSVPEELQYMLVTYKTIGYNNKIYQSCLLTATCHSKDSELMESFAQHLASERFGVGYAAIDYATHMVFIPRYRRIDANGKPIAAVSVVYLSERLQIVMTLLAERFFTSSSALNL